MARGRGASGRRNKGLRGMGHHAGRAGGTEIRRLRPAPITSPEPTPYEASFYIEKNLRNEFALVAGGKVIVDAELVGIRKNL